MGLLAGVDVGNATTEVALAEVKGTEVHFLGSALVSTTGIKGTPQNVRGIVLALSRALERARRSLDELGLICLNEAAPVIGDVAMEAVTETVVTESTMIGHNPSTPGGLGVGVGRTVLLGDLPFVPQGAEVIAVVPSSFDYEEASSVINEAISRGVEVKGAICQGDDGVLIANRLSRKIPIVDEVAMIDRVPLGMLACVEVAPPGRSVEVLSNPYGIASVFGLSPQETRYVVPVAKALIGNRSAVVVRTPAGEVKERRIPAGEIYVEGASGRLTCRVEEGASAIMELVRRSFPIRDVFGQPGTNVGGMMERVRRTMSDLTGLPINEVHIKDMLAVDVLVPQRVVGGIAGEMSLESGVALAVMVEASRIPMEMLAKVLKEEVPAEVLVEGVEAHMAVLGALTTPGTALPLAILDLGAGSTDASFMREDGSVELIHMAGAGDMVNMIIASELGIEDPMVAERIKRYPLCKVESPFHVRQEDGKVTFFEDPLEPRLFGRLALMADEGDLIPLELDLPMERVREVRRRAKREVFVTNCLRALERVSPAGNVRMLDHVVLVGGSALDFEVPNMITEVLARHGVVAGRGNIRGVEGPRNAVATGLVLSAARKLAGRDLGWS